MRRLLVLALLAALALPAAAGAHPLGNFTLNRLDVVRVSSDRVDVRWVLDQAEIPTFRERGLAPPAVLARKRADALGGLRLTVDGRPVALRPAGAGRIAFPAGQGGLRTTRVEGLLRARVRDPRIVVLRDDAYRGRLGWRSIVVAPGRGTAVRSDVPAQDVTRGLRAYPRDLLGDPADVRSATLRVRPGPAAGTVTAPRARGAGLATTGDRGGDRGFARLFSEAADGRGVLLVLLLAAFGWGAVHALSPGHGKAMVAAYLVGTRGTARQAALLGATVTITHTAGVFALGVVALALSQWVLPEDLYPWLTLASGLMVLGVGGAVLRGRVRALRHHHHDHDGHHHDPPERLAPRSLVALGASAGLIPCPSALVVLLAAVSRHELGLGLALIVAFSLGLAATLTALGLLVVRASRLLARAGGGGRVAAALPALSAVVILAAGGVLTANAIPQVVS